MTIEVIIEETVPYTSERCGIRLKIDPRIIGSIGDREVVRIIRDAMSMVGDKVEARAKEFGITLITLNSGGAVDSVRTEDNHRVQP